MKKYIVNVFLLVLPLFAVDVGGDIAVNTTWGPTGNPPDTVYNIISNINILTGVTLTIQPRVKIKSSGFGILVYGRLIAIGTNDSLITFTSARPSPAPGDWQGIGRADTTADSTILDHCIIRYARYGIDSYTPLLRVSNTTVDHCEYGIQTGTSAIVRNCTLATNTEAGLHCYGSPAESLGLGIEISGNHFQNNPVGIRLEDCTPLPRFLAPNTFAGNTMGIEITGSNQVIVQDNRTWNPAAAGIDCYVWSLIRIGGQGTLVIAPGHTFKFWGLGIWADHGRLVAVGTAVNKITFTSASDPPGPENWQGISIPYATADSVILDHCIIQYARYGIDSYTPLLRVSNSTVDHCEYGIQTGTSAIVRNCTLATNTEAGLHCYGSPAESLGLGIEISGNHFQNNPVGIRLEDCTPLPRFLAPNTFAGNTMGIEITGSNQVIVQDNRTWNPAAAGIDCYVWSLIRIGGQGTLVIAPGHTFKFWGLGIWADHGRLVAVGTAVNKITFTSASDPPGPENWQGISIPYATADSTILDHCIIRYATYGILSYTPLMRVSNTTVDHCRFGIETNRSVDINNTKIFANTTGIMCISGGNPIINYCEIHDNTDYAIFNSLNNYWINAENNWWGDSTGPRDTSDVDTLYNPFGLGDRVSDHVDYEPWLDNPIGIEEEKILPVEMLISTFTLLSPNPFKYRIGLAYLANNNEAIQIKIFNCLGQLVRIIENMGDKPGQRVIYWNGKDMRGIAVPAGVYWCQIENNKSIEIKKIIKVE